jgi:hypothetical protein
VKIRYVLGLNRSGSTIYERCEGTHDGVFAAGELHNLFLGPGVDRSCGCGQPLRACPVWSEVFVALHAETGEDIDSFIRRGAALQARTGRTRHVLHITRGKPDAMAFAEVMAALYSAINVVTGAEVVMDSSKTPAGALLLNLMPFAFDVVHLERDPLATIQSNSVWRTWDGVDPAISPPRISGSRLVSTEASIAFAATILRKQGRLTTVSFEDYVSRHASTTPLPVSHQAEGNPTRFGAAVVSAYEAHSRGTPSRRSRYEAAAISLLRRFS